MGVDTEKNLPVTVLSARLVLSLFIILFALAALVPSAAAQTAKELESLSEQIALGTEEVKRNALLSLQRFETESASRVAIEALNDESVVVRATAIGAIVYLPKSEALPILIPHLNDPSPFIRKEAVHALGEITNRKASPAIVSILTTDRDKEVRAAAALALGRSGSIGAVPALTQVLSRKPKKSRAFLRRSAARSIGQIAESAGNGKLSQTTPENYLPDRYKSFKDPKSAEGAFAAAVNVLERVLANPKESDDTRREAAFALGAIGQDSSSPVLRRFASADDYHLAEICREALLKLARN